MGNTSFLNIWATLVLDLGCLPNELVGAILPWNGAY